MTFVLSRLFALALFLGCMPGLAGATTLFPSLTGAPGKTLDIYSSTDLWAVRPLLEDFQHLHPAVSIRFHPYTSQLLDQHFRIAAARGDVQADVLISSAMGLQFKLVNDGYAQPFYSPNTRWLPLWAHWQHRAFAFTFEPAVIVYDPRRLSPEEVPRTRFELIELMRKQPKRFTGRVGTYDISRSGTGYLLATQDALQSSTFGRLIESFGRIRVQLYGSTLAMLQAIENGELLIGYNLLGSYVRAKIKAGSPLGMVLPADYTLILSRVAVIPKQAPDAELGKMFLNYLLSLRGQRVIARQSHLFALHPALHGPGTANGLRQRANGPLRPIGLGPGLLVFLDQMKRKHFLGEWRARYIGRRKLPSQVPPGMTASPIIRHPASKTRQSIAPRNHHAPERSRFHTLPCTDV